MFKIMVFKCRNENIFVSVAAMAGVEFPGYVLCMFIMVSKCRDENIFASVAAMAGVEFPGYVLCMFIMEGWGRRPVLSLCQVNFYNFCRVASGNSVSVSAGSLPEILFFIRRKRAPESPFPADFRQNASGGKI